MHHLRQVVQGQRGGFLAYSQDDRPAAAEENVGPARVPVPDEDVGRLKREVEALLGVLDLLEQAFVFPAETKRLDQGPVRGQIQRQEHRGEHQNQDPGGGVECAALREQQADQRREDRHDQAGERLGAGSERWRQPHCDAADQERKEDLVELAMLRVEQHHRQAPGGADRRAGEAEKTLPARRGFRSGPAQVVRALEDDTHQACQHQPDQPGDEEFVADIAPKGEPRDGRGEEDGGDVVSRQPVEKRDSLRQILSGGQGADRGA